MASNWPIEFSSIATAGYYVALRIGFAFPVDERNEFPPEWVDYYTQNGLMLRDPVLRWVYANSGAARWSEISANDTSGVLSTAKSFGLNFGVVICCMLEGPKAQRSFGTFARPDREFLGDEIAVLGFHLKRLHKLSLPPENITNAELEALQLVKDGLRLKEIAYQLGVSEGAIKQRLSGAKRKLGARTNTQAASRAVEFRMI
ncbi:MAG: autoinducer binding domain-containing protein [Paracoccaceae bacterium]